MWRDDSVRQFDFYARCSCGGPHGVGLMLDPDDGYLSIQDAYVRLSDNADLRGLWHRLKAAWWILSGQHGGYAEVVMTNEDIRAFAAAVAEGAARWERWQAEHAPPHEAAEDQEAT